MRNAIAVALLTLAAHPLAAPGQKRGEQPGQSAGLKVSVDLSFSVREYDPRKPGKATLKCVVRNDTKQAVEVPVGYDARAVTLKGDALTLYRRGMKGQETVKWFRVEPGKEQVVFELPLAEILSGNRRRDSAWMWSWERRPAPPPSPIHAHRKTGFVERASFVVRVEIGGVVLTSNPAVLKVKASE
jgi:hypothetical protein